MRGLDRGYANGVSLSFYYGATLPDSHKVLLGNGRQNRFIRLESAATLRRPEIEALIAAAASQAIEPAADNRARHADHPLDLKEAETATQGGEYERLSRRP